MLRNPVHFFNERGHSIMSADHLYGEIARLEREKEELERRCRSLSMRLKMLADDDSDTVQ